MKELFEDFEITTDSNAGFVLNLQKDGTFSYELQFVQTESINIHFTHKKTGETFSVDSKDDEMVLKEMSKTYVSLNRDFETLRKYYE